MITFMARRFIMIDTWLSRLIGRAWEDQATRINYLIDKIHASIQVASSTDYLMYIINLKCQLLEKYVKIEIKRESILKHIYRCDK